MEPCVSITIKVSKKPQNTQACHSFRTLAVKTTCFVLFTILAITHFDVRQSYCFTPSMEPTPVHK